MSYKNPVAFDGGLTSYGMPVISGPEFNVWNKKAKAFFVDGTNGSDSDNGTSWKTALATPLAALTLAEATMATGDPAYIYVAPGSYTISAVITVSYPNIHWRAVGWQFPYSSVLLTQATDVTAFCLAATAYNGSIVGFYITGDSSATPTAPTIVVASACVKYGIFANTFYTADVTKTLTAIDAEADQLMVMNNRFLACHIGVDNAGARSIINNNYFEDAGNASGHCAITLATGDVCEVGNNVINEYGTGGSNKGIIIASGSNYNYVHHNYIHALNSDPISDGGTNTMLVQNRKSIQTEGSFTITSGAAFDNEVLLGNIIT